jgi:hypothetical protein
VTTYDQPDRPAAMPTRHMAHLFSGWLSFLDHLREAHAVDPPAEDQGAWSLHEELHAPNAPNPPT